ncbi:MerR family transcriptional regulator [Roseovarius mucosus]|uniref:MerR family transcriptional regulator n=1 Tax=Roseovarius mucosus TaxID=215743 RepID=UPI003F716D3B
MKLKLETYTPSEAETITGVVQTTVRNWRRAGYLARQKGWARYNIADLLVMYSMGMLTSRGITPEAAQAFAGETARAIFQAMIWIDGAYTPEVETAARQEVPEDCEDIFKPVIARDVKARASGQSFGVSGLDQIEWLVIWANNEIEFFTSDRAEADFFSAYGRDEYVAGPVMLLCLPAIAGAVIDRLPRPAIRLAEETDA